MRGLVTLIGLLLAAIFVENISGKLIHAKFGGQATLSGPKLYVSNIKCSVEHNGLNYSLYPESNLTDAEYIGNYNDCAFIIRPINLDHAGKWRIHTIWRSEEYYNQFSTPTPDSESSSYTDYTIYVEEGNYKLLPTNVITGEDGSYATVYFGDHFDNIKTCYIVSDENYSTIPYILSDNGNGTSVGLRLYGKCGVRIPISDEWEGRWKLVQESEKYIIMTGNITIVSYPKIMSPEKSHETWHLGSDMEIRLNQNGIDNYCEMHRPDGQVITLINQKCKYPVEKISTIHNGIWKIRYLSQFSMNFLEKEIVINVIDPHAIETTVTTEDNMIHILCQTYVNEIEFCFFKTPNGTMINSLEGNGNEKYMYYGIGYRSISETDFAQCGLTIIQPSNEDYGSWKCITKDRKSVKILTASALTVNPQKEKIYGRVWEKDDYNYMDNQSHASTENV